MAKERVTLNLDREVFDKAMFHLKERGQSVSSYVTLVLKEFVNTVEGQPMHKRLDDMSLPEFLELAQYWVDMIKQEEGVTDEVEPD